MATTKKAGGKPKAAPAKAAPAHKILRIGVIQAGKIVEERLVRRRENVTIGASARNTIVVPASALPKSFTLFEVHGGRYYLVFDENMDGRVGVENQVLSLEKIRERGLAKPRGGKAGLYRLPLSEASRGKVVLGEVTLLFQFVTPPPVQPRPQLPPSVRGGLLGQIDWVLLSSFVTLSVLNFGFIVYANSLDFSHEVAVDVIPDSFAEYLPAVEKPKPPPKPTKVEAKGKGEKAKKKVAKKAGGGKRRAKRAGPAKPCDAACQAERAARRRARLAAQVAKMGALKLLGAKGRGPGAVADLMKGGDPGQALDKAFKGVASLNVGKGGGRRGGLSLKGGGGSGRVAGIGDLAGRVGGPGTVSTGKMVKEKVPRAIVKRSAPEIEGEMDANAVGRVIRRGMSAIKSCYQRALKRNPNLSGKVSLRLTIGATGRVTAVEIEADTVEDAAVTSCMKSYARRWRFPPPEGGAVDIVVPFNFQAAK